MQLTQAPRKRLLEENRELHQQERAKKKRRNQRINIGIKGKLDMMSRLGFGLTGREISKVLFSQTQDIRLCWTGSLLWALDFREDSCTVVH
jgi:hypothetical protein